MGSRAKQPGIVGHHARVNLARLDRGETLPTSIPYPIQTLSFGTNFAMVFLAEKWSSIMRSPQE